MCVGSIYILPTHSIADYIYIYNPRVRCSALLTVLFICIYGAVCIYQDGATPLYVAAQEGHEAVVSALLAVGADKNLHKEVRFVAAAGYDNALNAVKSAALAAVI